MEQPNKTTRLNLDNLDNQDTQEQLKALVDKLLFHADVNRATKLYYHLQKNVKEQNLENSTSTYNIVEPIIRRLQLVLIPTLKDDDLSDFLQSALLRLIIYPYVNVFKQIRIRLISFPFEYRDNEKKLIVNSILKNSEKLGTNNLTISGENKNRPPLIKYWLMDYKKTVGSGQKELIRISEYLTSSKNVNKLTAIEKNIFHDFLMLYNVLLIPSIELGALDNPDTDYFDASFILDQALINPPPYDPYEDVDPKDYEYFPGKSTTTKSVTPNAPLRTAQVERLNEEPTKKRVEFKEESDQVQTVHKIKPGSVTFEDNKSENKPLDISPKTEELPQAPKSSAPEMEKESYIPPKPQAPRREKVKQPKPDKNKSSFSLGGQAGPLTDVVNKRATHVPNPLTSSRNVGTLSVEDVRSMGGSAKEGANSISKKITELISKNPTERFQILTAWKESPLHKLYLTIGQESMGGTKTISEIAKQRQAAGEPYLSETEFEAVADINKSFS
ncbi:MAG: hypothetical protein ABIE68_00455 [bacterium]